MVQEKLKTLGAHFSAHVHGMFVNPKYTISRIVDERIEYKDLLVPFCAVLVAAIMSALGSSIWVIALTESYVMALLHTLKLIAYIFLLPIWFIFKWIAWAVLFHFIGSIVSGRDIMNTDILHRTLKLVGLAFVPFFLNVIPYFTLISAFWVWYLCLLSTRSNYRVTKKGAFIIVLPMLFVVVLSTLSRIGLLA